MNIFLILLLLFQRFDHYGLTLKSSKYALGASSLTYLGLHVSEKGNEPLRDRVEAIQNFPRSQAITKLRKFLGLYNFLLKLCSQSLSHVGSVGKILRRIYK
ncbi:hypothetical protein CEXT_587371 [Caerostris extrusa]|uniref:Uncharacterized protein n=1 Tax=Caerostris extrusa TaxID=172846 RepID=A0AAV4UCK2_CAEEX|nr:hypothetical protein CEXT_587371 [Caerostris extrusa]